MKKLLLSFAILLIVSSCSDDESVLPTVNQNSLKLTKTVAKDTNGIISETHEYEYNENGLLNKHVETETSGGTTTWILYYNSNNTIDYLTINGVQKIFIYTGGLISSDTFIEDGVLYTHFYTYNSSNQLIKEEQSQNGGGLEPSQTYVYDGNGNISNMTYNVGIPSESTTTYTYDNMKNPFRLAYSTNLSRIYNIGMNNIVSEGSSETFTYEYNSDNYPNKKDVFYNGTLTETIEYTYE